MDAACYLSTESDIDSLIVAAYADWEAGVSRARCLAAVAAACAARVSEVARLDQYIESMSQTRNKFYPSHPVDPDRPFGFDIEAMREAAANCYPCMAAVVNYVYDECER